MWSPAKLPDGREWPYGFGWHLGRVGSRRIVFHGGAWQGFKTFIGRVLDDRRTFVLLTNSSGAHEFKLAQGVLSIYYPNLRHREWRTLNHPPPVDIQNVRRLLLQIVKGNVTAEQFTDGGKLLFPGGMREIRTLLRTLSIPIAVIQTSEVISIDTVTTQTVYRLLLSDVLKSLVLRIELDPDGRVADLRIEPA